MIERLLKKMLTEAHEQLDRLGAPRTQMLPRIDQPERRQEVTLSVAERIERIPRRA